MNNALIQNKNIFGRLLFKKNHFYYLQFNILGTEKLYVFYVIEFGK